MIELLGDAAWFDRHLTVKDPLGEALAPRLRRSPGR